MIDGTARPLGVRTSEKLKPVVFVFFIMQFLLVYPQKMPFLKVSKDRYHIETSEGEPFFWLGDTAWELVHRLNRQEVIKYLDDRKEKGFTVIQTVILAEMNGINSPNFYGEKPLIEKDPTKLNEKYFSHLDFVLKEAVKRGIYIGLLPTWGDKFNKKWGAGPEIFTPKNAEKYGELLGKKYKDQANLIWILGGDRIPETEEHYKIIRSLARGIKQEDPNHLISYHPAGGKIASDYLSGDWLDLDMLQSGHSSLTKEYNYIEKALQNEPARPVINGEARYEETPDRFWENKDFGLLDDTDVRVSAYWSFLAGAAGYTYGSNDIWQMYSKGRGKVLNARLGWKKALDLPGAQQTKILKNFFTAFEWQKMRPAQELIISKNPEDAAHVLASKASEFAIFYNPEGRSFQVDLQRLNFEKHSALWFDPRTGTSVELTKKNSLKNDIFEAPSSGRGQDWLLVLLPKKHNLELTKHP